MDDKGDEPQWRMESGLMLNSTQIPDVILDVWMGILTARQFKVVMYIARKTFGWRKAVDTLTVDQIAKGQVTKKDKRMDAGTGMSERSVQETLGELMSMTDDAGPNPVVLRTENYRDDGSQIASTYGLNPYYRPPDIPVEEPDKRPGSPPESGEDGVRKIAPPPCGKSHPPTPMLQHPSTVPAELTRSQPPACQPKKTAAGLAFSHEVQAPNGESPAGRLAAAGYAHSERHPKDGLAAGDCVQAGTDANGSEVEAVLVEFGVGAGSRDRILAVGGTRPAAEIRARIVALKARKGVNDWIGMLVRTLKDGDPPPESYLRATQCAARNGPPRAKNRVNDYQDDPGRAYAGGSWKRAEDEPELIERTKAMLRDGMAKIGRAMPQVDTFRDDRAEEEEEGDE